MKKESASDKSKTPPPTRAADKVSTPAGGSAKGTAKGTAKAATTAISVAPTDHAPAPPRHVLGRLALSEEGFVFDPTSGNSYVANTVALRMLQGLRQGLDDAGVAATLAEQYEVDADEAQRDVLEFRQRLQSFGLIEQAGVTP